MKIKKCTIGKDHTKLEATQMETKITLLDVSQAGYAAPFFISSSSNLLTPADLQKTKTDLKSKKQEQETETNILKFEAFVHTEPTIDVDI